MTPIRVLSASEQVAASLREEILRGSFGELMPGAGRLTAELGVGRDTVEAALRELEEEGLLSNRGKRRRRGVALPKDHAPSALRVAVLFYEMGDETHDLFTRFQNRLKAAGHTVVHAPKNLTEIGGNLRRLSRMIKDTDADAWVVIAGTKEVHQCFVQRQVPVFALYGPPSKLRIAGIGLNLVSAVVTATRRLIALGHQRIVILEGNSTLSNPGADGVAFLDELAAHGITAGDYNMPGWEGGFDGFYRCLESLFSRTPPTAIFLYSTAEYFATTQFLVARGLRVPRDVSLVSMEQAPYFHRYQPSISHVRWNDQLLVNRIARWAKNISQGREDTRQTRVDAEFIEAGTVGAAP